MEKNFPKSELRKSLFQLKFVAALKNVKTILDRHNLGFIVLKGPHLGNTIYDNPIERMYGDLDLLIRPTEFSSVVNLLLSNGYKGPLVLSNRIATERAFYCWTMISPEMVPVELHRNLAGYGRFPVDVDQLFERAELFEINKIKVHGLGPEDLLLHLCIHMMKGHFKFLERKHIQDVALLIKKRNIAWDVFLGRVRIARCSHGVYYALLAAKNQFGGEIPERVLEQLIPRGLRKVWLNWHLDPSALPIYKYPSQKTFEIQARLGLMLMDRCADWIPFLWKYSGIRFRDLLMRRKVKNGNGVEQATLQFKEMSGRNPD